MKIKIGIVSAEPSGDLLGSQIIESLKDKFSEVECIGIGGGKLAEYGLSIDRKLIQVMGFIDPLLNFRKISSFRKKLIQQFQEEKIDLFIGIDSPDFNFEIHKQLSEAGIKTAQLVCPSVWAWRPGRVKKFKFLDYMLCLFPFELAYCGNVKRKSFFVGHPLVGQEQNFLNHNRENIIALLPGSRTSEIKQNLPEILEGFKKFNNTSLYQGLIPAYDKESETLINSLLHGYKNIQCKHVAAMEILSKSKAAVICSGTASFEALLTETPSMVVYKTHSLNYFLLSRLVKTDFIAIPNILAKGEVFKELVQNNFTANALSEELAHLTQNFESKNKELRRLKLDLSKPDFDSFAKYLYDDCRG